MKYRFIIFFYALTVCCMAIAQIPCEQVIAYTDKDCYLTGERIRVRIDVTVNDNPSPSCIAYVEVADTHKMVAQCMVALSKGQGWAEIPIPTDIHSGSYQITAYTRAMLNYGSDTYFQTIIGIINGEKRSQQDDIIYLPYDKYKGSSAETIGLLKKEKYEPGEEIRVSLPDYDQMGYAVSVCGTEISTDLPFGKKSVPHDFCLQHEIIAPEIEGHIVKSIVRNEIEAEISQTRLSLIGKMASICDGQRQTDGSYLYYTSDIYGNIPVLVNAFDIHDHPVTMDLVSPYATILPKDLPQLVVYCKEDELSHRAKDAYKQSLINQWLDIDSLNHSIGFMSAEPEYFYDLDEWTQMNNIKELLLEFVKGVKQQKINGSKKLFVFDKDTNKYSKLPALVLLDGMPINDIDEILLYDAHLIRYMQIYSGIFNFGNSFCCGVISFITRGGRLSNYKLKDGERLMSYAFPQNHLVFVNYTSSDCGTLLWIPSYKNKELAIIAPKKTGVYQIIIQGRDKQGEIIHSREIFEVAH